MSVVELHHRCGTIAGHAAHIRAGEKPCDACAAAKAEYDKRWRASGDRTQRARLSARAQTRALRVLSQVHKAEYDDLYAVFRDEAFREAGLGPPP